MWILSDRGFVSIVEDRQDPGRLLVRARREGDLEAFLDCLPDLRPEDKPVHTPDADYAWRVSLPRPMVSATLVKLASEVDYDNFKDAVAARQGYSRSRLYHDVWAILRRLQIG